MSNEQQTLADVRKAIDELPAPQRLAVMKCADIFRNQIAQIGTNAMLALALVGAELAAEE